MFSVEQGVAQGCSLSPILFSVFINDLLKDVEQAELGIQLSSGARVGGMLFADDSVPILGPTVRVNLFALRRTAVRFRIKNGS